MRSSLYLLLAIIAANVAALAIQLFLPRMLEPAAYTEFAVALGYAQLMASLSFDWLRTSVMRFAGEEAAGAESASLLRSAYGLVSLALLAIVFGLAIGGWWRPSCILAATTLLYAILQGRFDGELAYHRARFANESYARLGLSRGVLLVACALLAAVMSRSATGVMAGMSLALLLATILVSRGFHGGHTPRCRDITQLGSRAKELAAYGAFTAASSVFTFAFPAVARTAVAKTLPATESAAFIFALDLGLKAFAIAGMAINVLFLQNSVRAYDQGDGDLGKEEVLKTHLTTVAALVFPAIGLACGSKELAVMLVPPNLVEGFHRCYEWVVVGAGLLAFRQFGIDPAFFIAKHPKLSCVAPISTFVAFLLLVACLDLGSAWSIDSVSCVVLVSVVSSCLVAIITSRRVSRGLIAWRPLLWILACSVCAYALTLAAVASEISVFSKLLLLCSIGGLSYASAFVWANATLSLKKWRTA